MNCVFTIKPSKCKYNVTLVLNHYFFHHFHPLTVILNIVSEQGGARGSALFSKRIH
jgi:hypothetical protein